MTELRIYVEGGGTDSNQQADFRSGFDSFLKNLKRQAIDNDLDWRLIACGPRNAAYKFFMAAFDSHPNANLVLLVDSERPVSKPEWEHLRDPNDEWDLTEEYKDQVHLIVECMEAWLIEDLDALEEFYGVGFDRVAFDNANVKARRKNAILIALKAATRDTSKGKYGKLTHGVELLEVVNAEQVRLGAGQCDRLFSHLEDIIKAGCPLRP